MFYYSYEDDGSKGICGQSGSITVPCRKLWIFKRYVPNSEMNDRLDMLKANRKNPRITGFWCDNDDDIILTGADQAMFFRF